jgi:GDPmannose 4,6-dehydratase
MWLMLQQDQSDDYVVGTGLGATVRDFCEAAFSTLDLDYQKYVVTEERYLRPTEVDALIADSSKVNKKLNWSASTHWQELAKIMVEADFSNLSHAIN